MQRLLLISIAGAMSVIPVAGGMAVLKRDVPEPARLTVIEKNMASPTLQELGQKAGDPSNVQAPVEPLFLGVRKAQWI
jgi:hypothetical protein